MARSVSKGVAEKLRRADMHREDLDRRVARFIGTYPYRVIAQDDTQAGKRRWTIRVDRTPPTIRWGALIGECLFNFRSALDNLAYDLAVAHSGTLSETVERNSAFPIFWRTAPTENDLDRKIGAVHPQARRLIEKMQPYGRRDRAALKYLDALHNFDKHRTLHLVGARSIGMAGYGELEFERFDLNWVRLEDGDVLAEAPLSKHNQDPTFIFGISFAEEGPGAGAPDVTWMLSWISQHIRNGVIPPLLPYL